MNDSNSRPGLEASDAFFPALAAVLLAAFVMRGPVTGVGPIAAEVVSAYGTAWSVYGFLAALPIAAFGLASFPAPKLYAQLGLTGAAAAALLLLLCGAALRLIPSLAALGIGTFLLGSGIALLNVLMPVVVKTRWPKSVGAAMGLYTGMIGLSGAVGGLSAAPLFGLSNSVAAPFGFWTAAAAAALLVWAALMRPMVSRDAQISGAGGKRGSGTLSAIVRRPLAWILIAVMGLQSTLIYTAAAWLPSYWRSGGMAFDETGVWIFVFLCSGLPASVLTAKFFKMCPNDRTAGAVLTLLYLLGLFGWLEGGAWLLSASIAAGAAQGAMLSAAFLLIAKKTRTTGGMVAISTLSQGVGYLAAGTGPSIFGMLAGASSGEVFT